MLLPMLSLYGSRLVCLREYFHCMHLPVWLEILLSRIRIAVPCLSLRLSCCAAPALAPLAFCTLLSPQPGHAQSSLSTVSEVRRDTGAAHVPDQLGRVATVRGVITSRPLSVESGALISHLQDVTGGITLVAKSQGILPADLAIGDVVQATGELNQYRGAEELIVTDFERYATGSGIRPVSVTAAVASGERLEGQLVHLSGELVVNGSEDGQTSIRLRDNTGEIPLTLSRRFSDPAFRARLRDGGAVQITGIINQSDATPPFDSGYRVAPRGRCP